MRIFIQNVSDVQPIEHFPASGKAHCRFCGLVFTEENQTCQTCGIWQVKTRDDTCLITPAENWKQAAARPDNQLS